MTTPADMSERGSLSGALERLDWALARLETRVSKLISEAQNHNGGLFDQDRAQLAADLDAARGRERALEGAGAEASQALAKAIAEIQTVLAGGEPADTEFVEEEA